MRLISDPPVYRRPHDRSMPCFATIATTNSTLCKQLSLMILLVEESVSFCIGIGIVKCLTRSEELRKFTIVSSMLGHRG